MMSVANPKIFIIMATYNGALYINDQLDSIIGQTYENWELIIRDDGSTDDTVKIINTYVTDSRIKIIDIKSSSPGANGNFSALYKWVKEQLDPEYLMFADQDDIWKPYKIKITLDTLAGAEQTAPGLPIMAFGNLELIDEHNHVLSEKFKLSPHLTFNKTLIQNYALGCTIMLNKPFIVLMREISLKAENHDYWVSLLASGAGRFVFVAEKLIQYRQHGKNVTSQGSGLVKRLKRFTVQMHQQVASFNKRLLMLKAFEQEYGAVLIDNNRQILTSYLNSYQENLSSLIAVMFKYRIFKLGFLQNIGLFYCFILYYKQIKN